jgi:hypothetical protein
MALPIKPAAAKTFTRENWIWVPAIANPSAPTVAELTANTGLDFTCFLLADSGRPTQTQNRVRLQRRLCSGSTAESGGVTDYTGGTLRYSTNPQLPANDNANKAYTTLVPGSTGFLVNRLAVPVATAIAALQTVKVHAAELGSQWTGPSGDGEDGEVIVIQDWFHGDVYIDRAVVAA